MPREGRAKVDRRRFVARVRSQLSSGSCDMKCAYTFALDFVVFQPRAVSERNVNDGVSEVHGVIFGTRITLDNRGRAILFRYD